MSTREGHIATALSECSDADLVVAAKAGQLQAFGELVERTQGLARAVAYSATGNASVVEDMVQEALVTAWTRLGDLSDPAAFRPWLASIVRNTVRYWRRHQRRHAPSAQAGMEALADVASGMPSPLEAAASQQALQNTREAFMALSESYREALLLYYSHGESYECVAKALAVEPANARQRVHRARKKLASEASNVAATGRKLARGASAAAGVMLIIQERKAMAMSPWTAPATGAGHTPLFKGPGVFLGIGALGGAAIVAGIAAIVMLVGGERSSNATPNEAPSEARLSPRPAQTSPGEPAGAEAPEPFATPSEAPMGTVRMGVIPEGMVRMGRGNVGDKERGLRALKAEESLRHSPASDTVLEEAPEEESSLTRLPSKRTRTGKGRIRKHGPAVVADEAVKPLMKPDIDMRAVHREFWQ